MATLRLRGKRWQTEVRISGQYDSKTFGTKAEAVRWSSIRETEILDRAAGKLARASLRHALRKYADEVCPKHKGERWEINRLRQFETAPFVDQQMSEVTADDFSKWRDAELARGLKGASVARSLKLWASVFEIARKEWLFTKINPVRDIKKPRGSPHRKRTYIDAEIGLMLHALGWTGSTPTDSKQETAAALLVALDTGMRSGEMLALEWPQVDLARGVAVLLETKNGTSREVALFSKSREVLALLSRDGKRVFKMSGALRDKRFRDARDACGIVGTFHDLRHTAATRLSKVLSVLELCRQFGWTDPRMCMIYFNASAESIAQRA